MKLAAFLFTLTLSSAAPIPPPLSLSMRIRIQMCAAVQKQIYKTGPFCELCYPLCFLLCPSFSQHCVSGIEDLQYLPSLCTDSATTTFAVSPRGLVFTGSCPQACGCWRSCLRISSTCSALRQLFVCILQATQARHRRGQLSVWARQGQVRACFVCAHPCSSMN